MARGCTSGLHRILPIYNKSYWKYDKKIKLSKKQKIFINENILN